MKRIFMILMALATLALGPALAQERQSIQSITDDEEVIVLDDGSIWKVDDGGASGWTSGEDVIVVNDDVMINLDENGDKVEVHRLE